MTPAALTHRIVSPWTSVKRLLLGETVELNQEAAASFGPLRRCNVQGRAGVTPFCVVDVALDATSLAKLTADPQHGAATILYTIGTDDTHIPSVAEDQALRALLAKLGMAAADIAATLGTGVGGKTKAARAKAICDLLNSRIPKPPHKP